MNDVAASQKFDRQYWRWYFNVANFMRPAFHQQQFWTFRDISYNKFYGVRGCFTDDSANAL